MKFKIDDRVLYTGNRNNKKDEAYVIKHTRIWNNDNLYKISPLFPFEKHYPYAYINVWWSEEVLSLDIQYIRNERLNKILENESI